MKAYLIDPVLKQVTEVQYTGNYRNINEHIKADCFDLVRIDAKGDGIYISDTGLIDDTIPKFGMFLVTGTLRALPLAGYGLVLGCDQTGETVEPRITMEDVKAMITFPSFREIQRRAMGKEFD